METALLLHNIRSAHNVGSIFRTADAAGASHIYLTGYTPTPYDRFGRAQKEIRKTALGAEQTVEWSYTRSPKVAITRLKRKGWTVIGVEQDARAKEYRSVRMIGRTLFVFGNEIRGLSPSLRSSCDLLVEIPMRGRKESLNVAVAAGVVLFHYCAKE